MHRNRPDGHNTADFAGRRDLQGTGTWITGGVLGLLAFLGLLAASRAADEAFYYGGWILAIGCVVAIFFMVNKHYDRMDAQIARQRGHAEG